MRMVRLLIICSLLVTSVLIAGCGGEAQTAQDGDTVSVHYVGTLDGGSQFDSSRERDEPYSFTLGGSQTITGFENAVRGMKVGEIKTVRILPEDAYGLYNDDLVVTLSLSQLDEGIEPYIGQQLIMTQQDGQIGYVTVVAITDTDITVDANHELAGEALTFEIELLSIE